MPEALILYGAVSFGVAMGCYMGLRDTDEHVPPKSAVGYSMLAALIWPVWIVAFLNEERRRARG